MKIRAFITAMFKRKTKELFDSDQNQSNFPIHPLFIKMVEQASLYLLEYGFIVFNKNRYSATFKNNSGIYISLINQGYDFPEVYIGKNEAIKDMIRIDFMLELYLTGKTDLKEKHKLLNHFYDFEYEKNFIEIHYESIVSINPFPKAFYEWIKLNDQLIRNHTK